MSVVEFVNPLCLNLGSVAETLFAHGIGNLGASVKHNCRLNSETIVEPWPQTVKLGSVTNIRKKR